jgi:hypothetical protein
MSESFIQLNQTPNYQALIVNNYAEREDDQRQHIEDTDLYTVIRGNKFVYVPWAQVTDAERRAAEVVLNSPCDLGVC